MSKMNQKRSLKCSMIFQRYFSETWFTIVLATENKQLFVTNIFHVNNLVKIVNFSLQIFNRRLNHKKKNWKNKLKKLFILEDESKKMMTMIILKDSLILWKWWLKNLIIFSVQWWMFWITLLGKMWHLGTFLKHPIKCGCINFYLF